jgi:hypothetical protein
LGDVIMGMGMGLDIRLIVEYVKMIKPAIIPMMKKAIENVKKHK